MKPTKQQDTAPLRVNRGGSWYGSQPSRVRAVSRVTDEPAIRYDILGFRTALKGREPRV